ncbi:MAG: hypothetical protein KY393_06875 [Actinobacteria bacterium]|nr:hypothetical protein [Actinomycetota bacterium]
MTAGPSTRSTPEPVPITGITGGFAGLAATYARVRALAAAYDAAGALLMFWVDGQSPDERWYCAASDEEASAYGPSCTLDMFRALPHDADAATAVSGTTTPDSALEDAGDFLGMAMLIPGLRSMVKPLMIKAGKLMVVGRVGRSAGGRPFAGRRGRVIRTTVVRRDDVEPDERTD